MVPFQDDEEREAEEEEDDVVVDKWIPDEERSNDNIWFEKLVYKL